MISALRSDMCKSTRHSKITGDFGEALVLYWLSRHGFECARVDHTGIDLIAAKGERRYGISIKSRSRYPGTETTDVGIKTSDTEKVKAACKAFGLEPYYAVVVDGSRRVQAFVISLDDLLRVAPAKKNLHRWRMTEKALASYRRDSTIAVLQWDEVDCSRFNSVLPGGDVSA